MEIYPFLKAVITGFIISVPIGPVNLICIRRSLAEGQKKGFVSGLGSATADSLYAFIASLGLGFIVNFIHRESFLLDLAGGLVLIYLGIKIFLTHSARRDEQEESKGFLATYTSTFFIALANPATIIAVTAIFAGFGLAPSTHGTFYSSSFRTLGVFSGATLWWFTLSTLVSLFREKFDDRGMFLLNRISGSLISGVGLITILGII